MSEADPLAGVATGPRAPRVAGRFLSGEWRSLVMLNWEVDPAILRVLHPSAAMYGEWTQLALPVAEKLLAGAAA